MAIRHLPLTSAHPVRRKRPRNNDRGPTPLCSGRGAQSLFKEITGVSNIKAKKRGIFLVPSKCHNNFWGRFPGLSLLSCVIHVDTSSLLIPLTLVPSSSSKGTRQSVTGLPSVAARGGETAPQLGRITGRAPYDRQSPNKAAPSSPRDFCCSVLCRLAGPAPSRSEIRVRGLRAAANSLLVSGLSVL